MKEGEQPGGAAAGGVAVRDTAAVKEPDQGQMHIGEPGVKLDTSVVAGSATKALLVLQETAAATNSTCAAVFAYTCCMSGWHSAFECHST
jgi:hypothetical protein